MNTTIKSKSHKKNNVIPFIAEGDFFFSKGVEAFYKRKFDIALKWLKKATETSPNEALYPCQMSIIYTEIGAYHAANQLLLEVIDKHGDNYFDCYYLIANNYAHLGLLQDAQKYAQLYLNKTSDGEFKSETEQLLAVLDIGIEEDEDDDIDDLIDGEDEFLVYQETVFFHLERFEWDKAITLLKEMITLFPDSPLVKHEYHYALFFLGQSAEAIALEEELFSEQPDSLFARSNLAIFYYHEKLLDKANTLVESLSNVHPLHPQQCLRVAYTFAATENYDRAYQRFLRIPKSKVKGHINYFRTYSLTLYQIGFKQKAHDIWQEGCRLHSHLRTEPKPWMQNS